MSTINTDRTYGHKRAAGMNQYEYGDTRRPKPTAEETKRGCSHAVQLPAGSKFLRKAREGKIGRRV